MLKVTELVNGAHMGLQLSIGFFQSGPYHTGLFLIVVMQKQKQNQKWLYAHEARNHMLTLVFKALTALLK